ncbi:hypothetical protein [Actinokineospora iranica]|uniref:Mce-associated membrane protein n=1 Tax=Actinokineospora iranica TaxID=1271860 RepID=A0A1G6V0R3_9PSEU|nr:hypothetical protein [Actinokineospora iranica]SDD46465.1 hypothetical protein SAMN05216174_111158 [Actinokineospora iranica]
MTTTDTEEPPESSVTPPGPADSPDATDGAKGAADEGTRGVDGTGGAESAVGADGAEDNVGADSAGRADETGGAESAASDAGDTSGGDSADSANGAGRAEAGNGDDGGDAGGVAGKRPGPNPFVVAALVLAVAAGGLAAWFGVAWARAAGNEDLELARLRDEVARVASAGIVTFNSLDFHKVDEDFDRWAATATGPLLDEVNSRRAATKTTIEQAKTVTTATVLKTAVINLEKSEGKAEVIAAIRIDVAPEGKPAYQKFQRIRGSLDRTDTGWKLSGLGYVPFTPAG